MIRSLTQAAVRVITYYRISQRPTNPELGRGGCPSARVPADSECLVFGELRIVSDKREGLTFTVSPSLYVESLFQLFRVQIVKLRISQAQEAQV